MIQDKERGEGGHYTSPTEEDIRKARGIFAYTNEVFIKNIVVDPLDPAVDSLDKVSKTLSEKYPAFDLRFDGNYVVHGSGLILDHKNYARWINNPEADGYAVYLRPKGQQVPKFRDPRESRKCLLDFIGILSEKFTLVVGDHDWKEKIVKSAQKIWGESWRTNLNKSLLEY